MFEEGKEFVAGVPLCWRTAARPVGIVIHVPAFGQVKEQARDVLEHLSSRGYAAIVIDAFEHGERGSEDRQQITERVFSSFRRSMWTIIGMTALDVPTIAAWARGRFGTEAPLHLTGLSMGGDTVLAAAPLIDGVASVNAVISTPDWTRPGMRDIATGELVQQGRPDLRATLLHNVLGPIDHIDRYRDLAVRFVVGEKDRHVPPEAAYRFARLVNAKSGRGQVTIQEKHGLGHLDFLNYDWCADLNFNAGE